MAKGQGEATRPKDTFLTKLEGDEGESDSEHLFPLEPQCPSGVLRGLKCFSSKSAKLLFGTVLISVIVLAATSFHLRLSALEQQVKTLTNSPTQSLKFQGQKVNQGQGQKVIHGQEVIPESLEGVMQPNRVKRRAEQERHGSRRHSSSRGGQGQGHGSGGESSHAVEFMHVHPGRSESEGGESSVSNNSDSMLLTSVSRIPLMAMQDFCSKMREHCGPGSTGAKGDIGFPGDKGERGDKGEVGETGAIGPTGRTGSYGIKGQKGEPGLGFKGHDGFPGEPGLDGVPGRNGRNGVNGIPGVEGLPGPAGRDGTNGKDGTAGETGPKGDKGERGFTGLTGAVGPSGRDGIPGIPGVNTTVFVGGGIDTGALNTTILIPPSIMGSDVKVRPLVVMEGETVRLRCSATGSPVPRITWARKDGLGIHQGLIAYSDVADSVLNFTNVNRIHMGLYVCYADNAVTPSASRTHDLHVNFAPRIIVKKHQVGVILGRRIELECEVEAFPRGATAWQTPEGKYITSISNETKHTTASHEHDYYKVRMTLTVRYTTRSDLGLYFCIAKNMFDLVKGEVTLGELPSSHPTPPPGFESTTGPPKIFGKPHPDLEAEEELCRPPPPCPSCPPRIEVSSRLCTPSGYQLIDKFAWDVSRLGNYSLPDDKNRTAEGGCGLSAVGKPVFHGEFKHNGSWMREASAQVPESERYFKTHMDRTYVLYQYLNKTTFTKEQLELEHKPVLPHFQGNFHTIFSGSFYYVAAEPDRENRLRVIRYSLSQHKNVSEISLPYSSNASLPLYSPRSPVPSISKVDLAVDENGLWAIYTIPDSTNTIIVKIEVKENGLEIVYGWNITISHLHAGDMWITCGILYAVDSVRERDTKIRLGLDLYRRKLLKLDLPFTNPFKQTSMLAYNPGAKQLLTLDEGNLLVYPVKVSDLIPNEP